MRKGLVRAISADPAGVLLALDFDGTLAPIVDDPATARVHPRSADALARLAPKLGGVAIITGRPVRQVLDLGGFEGRAGLERLVICGQYGAERWDAESGALVEAPEPDAIVELREALPIWLARHGAEAARIEDKRLALAVHTRGLEPGLADRLVEPLTELARVHGLAIEPGRQVVELRAAGVDKGDALHAVARELSARTVVFAGDDLGDLPAFDAVDELRSDGVTGYLVCSASIEQDVLVPRADLVLDGPDDVATWLEELADAF